MKRLVAAGSLFALALTAFAQSTGEQQVLVPASKAAQRLYMSPSEFEQYKGAYDLSNGKTLYLVRRAARMFARVDEQTSHEIKYTGHGSFEATDGKMSMNLVFADDSVSGQLSYVDESPAVAGLAPKLVNIQLASK